MQRTVRLAGEDVPEADYLALCRDGREVAQVVGIERAREIIDAAVRDHGNARDGTGWLYVNESIGTAGKLVELIGARDAEALIDAMSGVGLLFYAKREWRRRRDAHIVGLLRRGFTADFVAEAVGLTPVQVRSIARASGLEPRRAPQRPSRRFLVARGCRAAARRITASGLPAHVLRRAAACPAYWRALAEIAASHGLELPTDSTAIDAERPKAD